MTSVQNSSGALQSWWISLGAAPVEVNGKIHLHLHRLHFTTEAAWQTTSMQLAALHWWEKVFSIGNVNSMTHYPILSGTHSPASVSILILFLEFSFIGNLEQEYSISLPELGCPHSFLSGLLLCSSLNTEGHFHLLYSLHKVNKMHLPQ